MQPGVNMLAHPRLQDAADENDEWVLLAARIPNQEFGLKDRDSLVLLKNKANGEFTVTVHPDGSLGFLDEDAEYSYPADRLNAALAKWNEMVVTVGVAPSHRYTGNV